MLPQIRMWEAAEPAPLLSRLTSSQGYRAAIEAQEHWDSNYVFRAIVLKLFIGTNLLVALMFGFPDVYSGCPGSSSSVGVIQFLMISGMPVGLWLFNKSCHRQKCSRALTKLGLAVMMLIYYLTLTLTDSSIHFMEHGRTPACNLTFTTSPNHLDYQTELSDFTFNFFFFSSIAEHRCVKQGVHPHPLLPTAVARSPHTLCFTMLLHIRMPSSTRYPLACILSAPLTRPYRSWSRLLVCFLHFGAWILVNVTYEEYTSPYVPLPERVWRWLTFAMGESTLLLTALIIALALEKGQRAQARSANAARSKTRTQTEPPHALAKAARVQARVQARTQARVPALSLSACAMHLAG